ncbi:methyl-accepting chemotaxis protein [Natronobacterium texcoconense]|nr:methyl-accepting chemotaxis protein [Natronobacterium texcoconense]
MEYVRKSYMRKFAAVMLVVLLITSAAAVFFYVDITGQITANVQNEMSMNADAEADGLSDWVEDYEQMTTLVAANEVLTDGSEVEIERTLRDEQEEMDDAVHAIHHVDLTTDRIIHTTDQSVAGDDIGELDLELHARLSDDDIREYDYTGDLNVDSTYTDTFEHGGDQLIAFMSPVEGTDRENAVMVVVSATDLADQFEDTIEGSYTQVVDADDGEVMIADEPDEVLSTYQTGADGEVVHAARVMGTDAVDATEYDDTDEVVGYAYVPGTDWVLVTHAPQDTAYELADDVATSLIVLITIALAGFVAIGATIGRSTANAIDDLAEDARSLSAGDTDIEISDDDRIDEVGQVRRSFEGIREYLETAADQADAIAGQEFDSAILEEEVPGKLGDSLETMHHDLEQSIENLEESKAEAEVAQEEAAEARQEAEQLADRLERKAAEFADVMADASEGDFTQRLDEDVDNEALSEIAAAFNAMLEDLERTVVDIQELASDVDDISSDVTHRVQEIERASDEVSHSTEEIATATADQSDRFQEVYGEMNDLSATIEEIASTADDVANVSEEAAGRADIAGDAASAIRTQMNALENQADAITDQVERLDDEMDEISEIVDLIDDIAGQTNLLALNASIEAAAAGEEGDGFAVVADEVKSLAEETGDATQEVDELITEVQASVDETVDEIEQMRERVDEGSEVIGEGIEAIDEIAAQVETANESIQSINDATDDQARASERVVNMVDEATTISEDTKDETETVAAAVEEQTATISEVASGANSLTERADDLRDSLDEFEVDAETVDDDSASDESDIVLRHDETDIETANDE